VLATIGVIVAFSVKQRGQRLLLTLLGLAALVVPVAQIHDMTETSLDKHLAYGIWFASMAAAYGCNRILRGLPVKGLVPLAACCILAISYPVADNWQAAWYKQRSWGDAASYIAALRPVVARTNGEIFAETQDYISKYYTPQGHEWTRWTNSIPLNPIQVPQNSWASMYAKILRSGNYGAIALFYTTTVPQLPTDMVVSGSSNIAHYELLNVVAENTGSSHTPMQGLPELTLALERNPEYKLISIGPYNATTTYGIYAIWERVGS